MKQTLKLESLMKSNKSSKKIISQTIGTKYFPLLQIQFMCQFLVAVGWQHLVRFPNVALAKISPTFIFNVVLQICGNTS